ncbi:MAG TPA: Gfo/Idh/MocA family oxidoreductase, partial [Candidatus Kapabacteria bacterium]|nr:Gfo/Idh/MocA family oxidoreductase [Candidatus Kapabacteria bacterium]
MHASFTTRRRFLFSLAALTALPELSWSEEPACYKAAIIGHTGAGDYGHGFDTIFERIENVSVEAIADANEGALEKAALRARAKRKYTDYREMLREERPQIVSIAPRHPDGHKEMALAAIEVGAHLIVEKPFTEHLSDADEIVSAAKAKGVHIVVGHKNRYTRPFALMQRHIAEGFFGQVLEMRVQGKQDQRAGGEDLIVLGTHDFDTMRFFFGDPNSCSAVVTTQGRPITKAHVRKGREPMLVAGDTVRARFEFGNNVACTWQSITAPDDWNLPPRGAERWGFHIFGTKRILAYYSGSEPLFYDSPFLGHTTKRSEWQPLPEPKAWPPRPHHLHLAHDLVHTIATSE